MSDFTKLLQTGIDKLRDKWRGEDKGTPPAPAEPDWKPAGIIFDLDTSRAVQLVLETNVPQNVTLERAREKYLQPVVDRVRDDLSRCEGLARWRSLRTQLDAARKRQGIAAAYFAELTARREGIELAAAPGLAAALQAVDAEIGTARAELDAAKRDVGTLEPLVVASYRDSDSQRYGQMGRACQASRKELTAIHEQTAAQLIAAISPLLTVMNEQMLALRELTKPEQLPLRLDDVSVAPAPTPEATEANQPDAVSAATVSPAVDGGTPAVSAVESVPQVA